MLKLYRVIFLVLLFITLGFTVKVTAQEVTNIVQFEGAPPRSNYDKLIEKNAKGEYFFLISSSKDSIIIDDQVFYYEDFPIEQQSEWFGSGGVNYLIKLSSDLRLEKVVKIRQSVSNENLSISKNRVFFGFQTSLYDYLYVDDMLIEPDNYNRSMVLEFDHELNFIGIPFRVKHMIDQIEAYGDSTLYIGAILAGVDTISFNGDTIFNYFHPNTFNDIQSNVVINYNYVEKKVNTFWRFGSPGGIDSMNGMEADSNGNVLITGVIGGSPTIFDNDTVIDIGGQSFVVSYYPSGDLHWYHHDHPLDRSASHGLYLEGNEVYARYSWRDSIRVGDNNIIAWNDGSLDFVPPRFALLNFSEEGNFQWLYLLNGLNTQYEFLDVTNKNDTLELSAFIYSSDTLIVADETFTDIHYAQCFIYLNARTGKEIGIDILNNNGFEQFVNFQCYYIDKDEDSDTERRLFMFKRGAFNLYGEDLGEEGEVIQYLIELNGELISQTKNLKETPNLFHAFPNPIISGETLQLKLKTNESGTLSIYDQSGRMVYGKKIFESENIIQINTEDLSSGLYLLNFSDKKRYKSQYIIIN